MISQHSKSPPLQQPVFPKLNLHTILADPASDTSALAAWVDEAQWLARASNHILADRVPDTSALGFAIDEAQ